MSSAERFVRHHRQQTDRAISQAYARLASDAVAQATFHELLHCARNRARRLLDAPVVNGHHPGIEALVNLSPIQVGTSPGGSRLARDIGVLAAGSVFACTAFDREAHGAGVPNDVVVCDR